MFNLIMAPITSFGQAQVRILKSLEGLKSDSWNKLRRKLKKWNRKEVRESEILKNSYFYIDFLDTNESLKRETISD